MNTVHIAIQNILITIFLSCYSPFLQPISPNFARTIPYFCTCDPHFLHALPHIFARTIPKSLHVLSPIFAHAIAHFAHAIPYFCNRYHHFWLPLFRSLSTSQIRVCYPLLPLWNKLTRRWCNHKCDVINSVCRILGWYSASNVTYLS